MRKSEPRAEVHVIYKEDRDVIRVTLFFGISVNLCMRYEALASMWRWSLL